MRVALIADTSKPVNLPAPQFHVVAGYIGGDTPHVWTHRDWGKFPGFKKLPIFVRSNTVGAAGGEADAFMALEQLYSLGAPRHIVVVYDRETNDDKEATQAFYDVMHWAGNFVWPYGSSGNIFNHPKCDGYAVADPTTPIRPHMFAHRHVMWTQYEFDDARGYDEGEVRLWQVEHKMRAW